MKENEWKLKRREWEERMRNIIIKGIEKKENKRRKVVEGVLRDIGVRMEIGEIRRIRGDKEKVREMILTKLGNKEQKSDVMINKKKLKERKEKIIEN